MNQPNVESQAIRAHRRQWLLVVMGYGCHGLLVIMGYWLLRINGCQSLMINKAYGRQWLPVLSHGLLVVKD